MLSKVRNRNAEEYSARDLSLVAGANGFSSLAGLPFLGSDQVDELDFR